MRDLLKIEEVAQILGTSELDIYTYLKQGNLKFTKIEEDECDLKITKDSVEKFLLEKKDKENPNISAKEDKVSLEKLEKIIEKILIKNTHQLQKPIEKQALFIAGKVTQENQDLKEKIKTIEKENLDLKEKIKNLIEPPEELRSKFNKQKSELEKLKVENEETASSLLEKVEDCIKLQQEKQKLQQEKDFAISKVQNICKEKKELDEELERLKNENKTLLQKVNSMESSLKDEEEKTEKLKKEKENLKKEKNYLEEVKGFIKDEKEELTATIINLKADNEALKIILKDREKELLDFAEALEKSRMSWWKKLLGYKK